MTVSEFFGCSFMAYGPALAMFCFTVAVDPMRVIILIASAFFWLLSLLLSSLLWICLPVSVSEHLAIGLVFSVIFQEVFRYIVYKLIRYAEFGMEAITENGQELVDNKHILAYVAGLGFGVMSGAFSLINVLADAVGPGTIGLIAGTQQFFMASSAFTLCFTLLHVFWGVIFFAGLDNKQYYYLAWVVLTHYAASGLTFLNRKQLYAASLVPCIVIVVLNALLAFRVAGGTWSSVKQTLKSTRGR